MVKLQCPNSSIKDLTKKVYMKGKNIYRIGETLHNPSPQDITSSTYYLVNITSDRENSKK